MITKCEAIADDERAADQARFPIERLAELGETAEALWAVDRFLGRLGQERVFETVRLAELGAEVALAAGDLPRVERYLGVAEATEPFNKRKCDRGFSLDAVREWRASHGLLDPNDAANEEQRNKALFHGARRRCDDALAAGRQEAARVALAEMEAAARSLGSKTEGGCSLVDVIERYVELEDAGAVKRLLRRLDKEERESILDSERLARLGMTREAVARATRDAESALAELATMTDPNIHFPVMALERKVRFLVEQGEATVARTLVRRALRELPTWPVFEVGWCTSGVYGLLAKAAAAVGEQERAAELLDRAKADASVEKRRGAKHGAVGAALTTQAEMGQVDQVLAAAQKLRSPTERRLQVAKLLARAGRWKQLQDVLHLVASPEEAAQTCWAIHFELPGNAPG